MRTLIVGLVLIFFSGPLLAQTKATVRKSEPTHISSSDAGVLVGVGVVGYLVIAAIALFIQFIPFMIALARGHNNAMPIFLVCFFLSWTCIGLVIALIWSFSDNTKTTRYRR